jgi:hypothetical protein
MTHNAVEPIIIEEGWCLSQKEPPVYIKRVVLENVRGFEKLDFRFERPNGKYAGWTVITGDNASGKTTLLKAMAAALVGPDAVRSLQPSWKGWPKRGAKEAVIAIEIQSGPNDQFEQGRPYQKPFWAELKLAENGGPETSVLPGRKKGRKGKGPTHGPWAENPAGWFCVGYGPFRRLYGASPDAQRIMSGPSRIARFATMFREDATLGECELWLKELHHRSLEAREKDKSLLEQVELILNSDFLQNGLRVDRVDSEGLWLRHPDGAVLPLGDMSEGYRAAIAMLIDILRHLGSVAGNDQLVTNANIERPFIDHSGVVLIDEIDSHLHPQWQQKVGFWLKEIFPNIQFIVTTHSPIICQAADENGIFNLPGPGSEESPFQLRKEDYEKIVRSKIDEIYLSPAFSLTHTRSQKAVKNREEYARLRSKESSLGLTEQERHQRKLLGVQWIGDEPPDERN